MHFTRAHRTLFYTGSTAAGLLIFLFYVRYILSPDAGSTFLSSEVINTMDNGKDWFTSTSKALDTPLAHPREKQPIVPRIWQMSKASFLSSWQTQNPGYRFELLVDSAADSIVEEITREHLPSLSPIFANISVPILKWDFLRYLLLWQYGGYYSDSDATPLIPIEDWISTKYDRGSINTIIGLEVDEPDLTDPKKIESMSFTSNMQFCQWMLASNPKHEILRNVINSIISDITAFQDVAPTRMQILQTTGPGAYTRAVKKYIQEHVPDFDLSELFLIQEPVQVADILFLPQHSFAYYGSYSSRPKDPEAEKFALIYHSLAGSWKTSENEPLPDPSENLGADSTENEDGESDNFDALQTDASGHELDPEPFSRNDELIDSPFTSDVPATVHRPVLESR